MPRRKYVSISSLYSQDDSGWETQKMSQTQTLCHFPRERTNAHSRQRSLRELAFLNCNHREKSGKGFLEQFNHQTTSAKGQGNACQVSCCRDRQAQRGLCLAAAGFPAQRHPQLAKCDKTTYSELKPCSRTTDDSVRHHLGVLHPLLANKPISLCFTSEPQFIKTPVLHTWKSCWASYWAPL